MPTDDYGQGVPYLDYTDQPDLKVLGEGIVKATTPLTNMSFASASQRDATLTSPVEGMEAWLRDANLKTIYDGTGWAVMGAGVQSWTTVGLVSGFAHDGNSNGTFQYRRINMFGEPTIQFRGAVDVTYSGSTIPNSGVLNSTALPTAARPTTTRTIVVPCSDVASSRITLKLDIQTSGFLKIYGTGSSNTPPWIGFNGCFSSL